MRWDLKFFLLKHYSASKLKNKFRHDLKKLWREFKKIANDSSLARFDTLMSELNIMEDLRYPGKGYMFSSELRKGPRHSASGPATKGLIQHRVNLEEIDEFVEVLLTGRVNPKYIRTILHLDAMAQYKRENLHPFFS